VGNGKPPHIATIRDVARLAGVSVATVSRSINGSPSVSPDTRDRINRAAESLNYTPHAGARSLSIAKTQAIGVVLPDLFGEFFSELVRGLDRRAGELGYHLMLSSLHADLARVTRAVSTMRGRVDGVIVMAPQLPVKTLTATLPAGMPALLLNSERNRTHPVITFDNRSGAVAVTRYLIGLGRRHIVHISGPAGNIDAAEREAGYRAAMAEFAPDAPVTVVEGRFDDESGAAALRDLLAAGTKVDAIFAANDMMAIGALTWARQNGIAVPGQIAVAGFDDIPLAHYLGLTTMRVHVAELGGRAVTRLAAMIDGDDAGKKLEIITPDLVIRESTRQ
jgi:LacI family transcriptional regulator